MEDYIQLPLTATALRKWLRFSEKGGIGKAVSIADRLAESGTDELMFMEGDAITVLMQLDRTRYLGSCEGVVGIFREEDVNFLTKLKKPVFTKKLKSDQEERSLARNATPSSPALHDLGSPVTPQAMSPGHKPHFHKFNRAVSAPVSSATLQSLQSVQPRVPSPSDQDMPSKESIGNAHVLPPASMSLMNELSLGGNRSTSALEDNDDILSSYVYEVEEGAAGSFATSRSLKNDGGVHSPHHVPSSSLDSRQNRSVRPESVSHLLAPLHIGQNSAPEAAQLNTSTSASAPSQARKVHILPNLPAGVSLKQLRENRSPRFALFPRSASFSNLGGETSRGGYSNDHSANVNLASPSRAPQNITDFFLPVDNVWSEPTQTPLASPVPSSFVSVESPTSPLSPSSVSYPEYGNLATSVSTNAIEHHSHGVWQQHDLQQRKQTDLHRTTSHREDAASDTRSLSSATSSFKGLRHSRSMSSLTRAGTMFQRRPSLPNRTDSNAGSIGTEGVVELNNAQFEFVHPNGTDSGGDSPHSNADSSQSGGSARLVTRPSASAKERVKSIYVFDLPEQSPAPSHRVDKYGFMHSQHTSLPIHELDMPDSNNASALQAYRTRELKWVSIMSSMAARNARSSNKVRKLVNHGIPDSVRGKAWTFLADTSSRKKDSLYHDLCARETPMEAPEISKDISDCFCDHSHFSDEDSIGRQDLHSILRALLHYLPQIEYRQGLCYLAGMLLLHVEAESAFWLLVAMVLDYLPSYFIKGRKGSMLDAYMLAYIVQKGEPDLQRHLSAQGIPLESIFESWLASGFVRTLPWASQLRIMDLFFAGERPSQLGIRVGLAIIDLLRDHLLASRQNAVRLLHSPPPDLLEPSSLLPSLLTIKIPGKTFKKARKWAQDRCVSVS